MTSLAPRLDNYERNLIINGNFDFWQRGTSFSMVGALADAYNTDRFRVDMGTNQATATVSQSTDVPTQAQSGYQSRYSLLYSQGASATNCGANFKHKLEGHDFQGIYGKPFRLQFWVKSSVAGQFSVTFTNTLSASPGMAYVATYTVGSSTWTKIALDIPANTSGSWNFDNTIGMSIIWAFGNAGGEGASTSTVNQWQSVATYTSFATGNATVIATNATFQIAQVMLIPQSFTTAGASTVDVPFQRAGRSIQEELAMCQRYYEKSYDPDVVPGTAGVPINVTFIVFDTGSLARLFFVHGNIFKTVKRAAGGVFKIYSEDGTAAGIIGSVSAYNNSATKLTINSGSSPNTVGFANSFVTSTTSATAGLPYQGNWTVDAEL